MYAQQVLMSTISIGETGVGRYTLHESTCYIQILK
jgi:hypothetical protein